MSTLLQELCEFLANKLCVKLDQTTPSSLGRCILICEREIPDDQIKGFVVEFYQKPDSQFTFQSTDNGVKETFGGSIYKRRTGVR